MWRLVLTVSLLCWSCEASVTCRDENNGAVDWYILYKAPKQKNKLTGLEYLYIYPAGAQKKVTRNNKPINHPNGILANTLRPLFTNPVPPNFGFISYNDQPPKTYPQPDHTFGHSKGVVMVEKGGAGVWLLHSTPQFPYQRHQNHFWPESGNRNAQTFICVTFNYDQFQPIGKHLQHIRAFPFDFRIPADFYQELQDVVNKVTVPPSSDFPELRSSGGQAFRSIAKQQSEKGEVTVGDLYVTILQKYNSDVDVQTWGCQKDRSGDTTVGDKAVRNIKCINNLLGIWGPTKDHSKWCVTKDQNRPWTCIADVNRAPSQFKRRGGALCINDEEITRIFKNFAVAEDKCPPPGKDNCELSTFYTARSRWFYRTNRHQKAPNRRWG